MHRCILMTVLVSFLIAGCGFAAEQRYADSFWDGVESFDADRAENSMAAQLDISASVAGESRPAVFLHPMNEGRAVLTYERAQLAVGPNQTLFFFAYAGLRDGFDWDDEDAPPDGVRYYLMADGKDVASCELKRHGWEPMIGKLYEAPAAQGPRFEATLAIATDSGPAHNASYDWALLGEPTVVSVDSKPLAANASILGASGICIAQAAGRTGKLTVQGLDAAGAPVADAVASSEFTPGSDLAFVRFNFAQAPDCVAWTWKLQGATNATVLGGSWRPWLWIDHVGPIHAANFANEPMKVRVAVRNRGKGAVVADHGATVTCDGQSKPLTRLGPGETASVEFDLGVVEEGHKAAATAVLGEQSAASSAPLTLWPAMPQLPAECPAQAETLKPDGQYTVVQNPFCRWVICDNLPGLGAIVYVRTEDGWELTGTVAPLLEIAFGEGGYGHPSFANLEARRDDEGVRFDAEVEIGAGDRCHITGFLLDESPAMQIDLTINPLKPNKLAAVRGPAVHAGDRGTGTDKGIAIFPGLEYLYGEERSSSTRDLAPPLHERWTPHKFKITVPMMLVQTRDGGPFMAVAWDPNQKWDGENIAPGASFASPDFLTQQDNHLMQLMLPSVPDSIPESARMAEEPVELQPGKPWTLTQYIITAQLEPDVTAAYEWFDQLIGYPEPEKWARDFEDEIALCRLGYMKTVWEPETQTTRHAVGWAGANSPGAAALLLMDARGVAEGQTKSEVMDHVNLIANKTLREQGEAGLASSAICHIMGWEFPYHWGHVAGALDGMKGAAYGALTSQEENGGWGYHPGEKEQVLGEAGVQTSGICGRSAYTLAKYAAITGDPEVLTAMTKAMDRLREFNVPRGAQGWECPILQPDVLASAYCLRAAVWAHMATGDEQYLEDARFWARTGLPFQYVWDDGERPGMRYASIPVFGSTFYRHTWIGLPVQWCGLVYAYGLVELMRFDDNDLWLRQVDGMTSSATYQQWPEDNEELAGSYPDSFGAWFTRRNPVFINPEDIELNVLALNGLDPGLRAVPVSLGDDLIHVTAPADIGCDVQDGVLSIEGAYLPGEIMYVSVAPVSVGDGAQFTVNGQALARADSLPHGSVGWTHRADLNMLVLGVTCDGEGLASITATGLKRELPMAASATDTWEFGADVQGWQGDNNCGVSWQDGVMKITVAGPDPYALSGPARIDGDAHKKLTARVRLSAGTNVGLFWRSSSSPGWGPDKEVQAAVPGDGKWHEIEFDLTGHGLWRRSIVQIRFDVEPAGVPNGTTLEVDWIRPE